MHLLAYCYAVRGPQPEAKLAPAEDGPDEVPHFTEGLLSQATKPANINLLERLYPSWPLSRQCVERLRDLSTLRQALCIGHIVRWYLTQLAQLLTAP